MSVHKKNLERETGCSAYINYSFLFIIIVGYDNVGDDEYDDDDQDNYDDDGHDDDEYDDDDNDDNSVDDDGEVNRRLRR